MRPLAVIGNVNVDLILGPGRTLAEGRDRNHRRS